MACSDNIYDEKSWSRNFPYSIYMACTAYIYDEKFVPETSTSASTWPVNRIRMTKNLFPRLSLHPLQACRAYIYDERSWSRDFTYIYMACTPCIYDDKFGPESSHTASIWPVQPIYMTKKFRPETSLLENVTLRVPPGNLRDFSLFGVCPSNKHCPARCAYAAKAVGKYLDIFTVGAVSLNHICTST
jgi:hypothetical protein